MSYKSTSNESDYKLTSIGKCTANYPDVSCKLHLYSYRGHVHLQGCVFRWGLEIRMNVIITSWARKWTYIPLLFADSISSGENYNIRCWWDLIRPEQLSSCSVCCTQCLPDFLAVVIHFIIYNCYKNKKCKLRLILIILSFLNKIHRWFSGLISSAR